MYKPNKDEKDRIIAAIIGIVSTVLVFTVVIILRDHMVIKPQYTAGSSTVSTTAGDSADTSSANKQSNSNALSNYDGYVPPVLDENKTHYADIVVKNYGTITVKLEHDDAPMSAANFVDLAKKGFYDGLTFHRIYSGFMIQGGDPNGNGTGGPGHTIFGEFESNGFANELKHTRGALSMARSSDKNSAGSQFFIMHETATHLDGDYAVFGYVTEGMDIVDRICEDAQPIDDNGSILAAEQPIITKITVREQ